MPNQYIGSPGTTQEIAARLGLHRAGRDWRGDCPACGYAETLSITEKAGRTLWWCASCQDQAAITALLRGFGDLPAAPHDPAPARASDAERIERARAIWNGAEQITADSPAMLYLRRRRIERLATSPALRWRPDTPHTGGGRRVALLGRVDAADGTLCGLQRIYITPDGQKAAIEPVKASVGIVAGGAVRLGRPVDRALTVGEGVESSAAAGLLLRLPAWAAISAGNLAHSMTLPASVKRVIIAADHDAPGIAAAEQAAVRWRDEGRAVRIIRAQREGADAADLIREVRP
jgi:putative DNA primase/helicase